jgi:hypothetical protein
MTVKENRELRARRRAELRHLLMLCGFEPPNGIALNAVLSQCPDVDLAFTALTMTPRPRWVQELVDPLSVSAS